MISPKNEKSKLVSILINDELKNEQSEEEDDDDSNEKPLIEKAKQTKTKKKSTKKGYYKLNEQDRENVGELFDPNSKIVNAVDYDDEDEYEDDEDEDEKTQLTKNFPKKKSRHDKKSIRKKLFGAKSNKQNLSKQNSTDDELGLGKIKIILPRKKNKSKLIKYKIRKCMRSFFSLCFLLSALIVVFILLYFKRQYLNQFVKDHLSNPSSSVKRTLEEQSKHCDMLIVNNLWNITLSKLIVDAPLKLIDVNLDNNLDILVPFGTNIDQTKYDPILCQMYFNQTDSDEFMYCGGGLLLIDGNTGKELWRIYTEHQINSVSCVIDLDGDEINDCFLTGPKAQFYTISGKNGRIIWRLDLKEEIRYNSNIAFHTPLLLPRDFDSDGLNDILVMHGGDYRRTKSTAARLICLSSRTGRILFWDEVPDKKDSEIPAILFNRNAKHNLDTVEIIYGTGSFNHNGSLWAINLDEFNQKNSLKNSIQIHEDCCKGIVTPPILIDLNKDHIQDIVIAKSNSTLTAINGRTFVELWHTKFSLNTEFYIPPSVGFFDDDDVPDFLVQYEIGDGFPSSYYSEVQVLNGKNGKPMLNEPFRMLIGSRSSPITISVDTKNKINDKRSNNTNDQTIDSFDLFLFWQITCDNQEQELKKLTAGQLDQFRYKLKFNSINELKKADFCKLRFDKNSLSRLNSISYGNIMTTIYDSNECASKELEQNNKFNYTKIGMDFLSKNTDLFVKYMKSYDQENGIYTPNEDDDALTDFQNSKRNNYRGDSSFSSNNGFYFPNVNDKQDYSSFKNRAPNDYYSFNQQLQNSPNQPSNQYNDNGNNLANFWNQFQQKQQPQFPTYGQGFDLNNFNNRNKFIKKKSSPYDVQNLEDIFRRNKRSTMIGTNDVEAKFIHKIYSTGIILIKNKKLSLTKIFKNFFSYSCTF